MYLLDALGDGAVPFVLFGFSLISRPFPLVGQGMMNLMSPPGAVGR